MPRLLKRLKRKNTNNAAGVDFSVPYKGSTGESQMREVAKKKWAHNASPEEIALGLKLTQDPNGNYIARTKLESKA